MAVLGHILKSVHDANRWFGATDELRRKMSCREEIMQRGSSDSVNERVEIGKLNRK